MAQNTKRYAVSYARYEGPTIEEGGAADEGVIADELSLRDALAMASEVQGDITNGQYRGYANWISWSGEAHHEERTLHIPLTVTAASLRRILRLAVSRQVKMAAESPRWNWAAAWMRAEDMGIDVRRGVDFRFEDGCGHITYEGGSYKYDLHVVLPVL